MNAKEIRTAKALAHPNIALIKYWGKAEGPGNEPAVSSLSLTLDTLSTETTLRFDPDLKQDELILNGESNGEKLARISKNLDLMRTLADDRTPCRIESDNNFPTGAGLASSASGFAALVCAANKALSLNLSLKRQSMLARSMSGSAARSMYGGFVKISLADAESSATDFGAAFAAPIAEASHWPLEVCVGVVSEKEKSVGSTEGMQRSKLTSPYYEAWIQGNDDDTARAEKLVLARDFEKLAELSEFSCLKMHALALASRPGLLYWAAATVEAMHCIRALRASGIPVFFTIDAGPQIKAICEKGYGDKVEQALASLPGIKRTIRCGLGEGARVLAS